MLSFLGRIASRHPLSSCVASRRLPTAAAPLLRYPSKRAALVVRSVWSTGTDVEATSSYAYRSLSPSEVTKASSVVKDALGENTDARFVTVTLREPPMGSSAATISKRSAEVLILTPSTGIATEFTVDLESNEITSQTDLPKGVQPLLTPEDCDLAEEISKSSHELKEILLERYGIDDITKIAADPWSVHLAEEADLELTTDPTTGKPRRLVQTFLYQRVDGKDLEDNHYSHPIDILPVVDLNSKTVVRIDGLDRLPAPKIPTASVNYHRNLIGTNSYLQTSWREKALKELNVVQPDGPTFEVTDGNLVTWQNWSFRVQFNYREGLVLQDVMFDGRSVLQRGSLVEMAVPYGDPHPPYTRKCAFDVGDYGLGYCANSLELGCDCLGHIHYFDAVLSDVNGNPTVKPKAICMHEQDGGLLWKHVEYRNGHNESRRARELVLSSIATVVNYEYLFYWYFKLDGSIDFEIRLSGELSTNLLSADEEKAGSPTHGTMVAPGVNAQVHQHMFCARLHMGVDGVENTVSEVDVVGQPDGSPVGNAFMAQETVFETEQDAIRLYDATKARAWKIQNAQGKVNPISGKPPAYKLIPFTRGAAQPPLITDPNVCQVNKKGAFAEKHLWVTPYEPNERYPAGEYTPQATPPYDKGVPAWTSQDRSILASNVVLWHAFGVTHVPRPEDFPVMPCETTGFTLKPDGFLSGNPAIDLPPNVNSGSKLDECCGTK